MPKARLTDVMLRSTKPGMYWDDTPGLPGFGCRVGSNAKTFVILQGTTGRRVKLGRYPTLTLAAAREEARKRVALTTLGIQPLAPSINFADAVSIFLRVVEARVKPRTLRDYRYHLSRHWLPHFRSKPLSEIRRTEISQKVDGLIATPAEANHALAVVKVFFSWAVSKGYTENSPAGRIGAPARLKPHDRVLSDEELRAIFNRAIEVGHPYGAILRLLVLTGARRLEVASLRWEYVDQIDRTITLPPAIVKNNRAHRFPFGLAVAAMLAAIPSRQGYLFPAAVEHVRGKPTTIFNGWQKAKVAFDAKLVGVLPWTLHDLRRTFATNLAALGTPVHVTERLLNHISGTVSGVAAIYNRHSYMDEMRTAIAAWERKLDSLVQK